MRKFIIIGLLLGAASVHAQVTINFADYQPANNDTYGIYTTDTSVMPGSSGENVVWDFSNVPMGELYNYVITDCDASSDCADYPGSAYFTSVQGFVGKGVFYINDATGEHVKGRDNGPASNYVYPDPQQLIKFPMTYLDTFSDVFSFHPKGISPSLATANGYNNSLIDAYGTLKTPIGVYTNVLRRRTFIDITYPGSNHQVEDDYIWYQAGTSHPIMSIINVLSSSTKMVSFTNSIPKNIDGTGTNKLSRSSLVKIFPNPSRGSFNVSFEGNGLTNLVVKDLLGKSIYSKVINAPGNKNYTAEVNTSSWAKGIYLVEFVTSSGSFVRKIVIE